MVQHSSFARHFGPVRSNALFPINPTSNGYAGRMREFEHSQQHASLYANNYSQEQNQAFAAAFNEITEAFRTAMQAGLSVSEDAVQDIVKRHYEFCAQFWTPNRDAYKSLATSYLLPTPYRDTYESIQPGLAKYHYDALVLWADRNLE